MCTIIAIHRLRDDLPLIVAANRDEWLHRASAPPRLLRDDPPVLGGQDLARGGTWAAASARGLFVGLTNQRPSAPLAPAPRSRGELVLEAVDLGTVSRIEAWLTGIDTSEYGPFNLLFGDGEHLLVAYGRPGRPLEAHALPPGVHVLTNGRLGSPAFPKAQRAAALVAPLLHRPWPDLCGGLQATLADHTLPPVSSLPAPAPGFPFPPDVAHALQALCVHLPGYGTRSATILALEPGALRHYLHAEGPPCQAPFEDRIGLAIRA